jgi:hypothetical protein
MHSHAYFLAVRSTLSALVCSLFHCSGRKSDRRLGAFPLTTSRLWPERPIDQFCFLPPIIARSVPQEDPLTATMTALEEQRSEKYRHALIAVVSIGVRARQLGGADAWLLCPPGISRMNIPTVIELVTCRNSR